MDSQHNRNSTVLGTASSLEPSELTAAEVERFFEALSVIVDALKTLFGAACACEISKLEEGQLRVVKSSNPEDIGLEIQISPEEVAHLQDNIHLSETGKTVRTVAIPIKSGDRLIGRMMVTVDLSVPLIDLLEQLGSIPKAPASVPAVKSSDDLVRSKIDEALRKTAAQRGISYQSKNKMVVRELFEAGIFEVRGAIDVVAGELGVSRYTIYNYLREIKG